jgi:hypothetical protein
MTVGAARKSDAKPKPAPRPRVTPKPEPEPQPLNRQQGVLGLFQGIAMPLAFAAPADAAAIVIHAEPISHAAAEAAANDPRFAALLDRVLALGPYGALLGAVMPLALQLLANHGYVPENFVKPLGLSTKDELMTAMMAMQPTMQTDNGSGPSGDNAA